MFSERRLRVSSAEGSIVTVTRAACIASPSAVGMAAAFLRMAAEGVRKSLAVRTSRQAEG